jgi:hypothetical protein
MGVVVSIMTQTTTRQQMCGRNNKFVSLGKKSAPSYLIYKKLIGFIKRLEQHTYKTIIFTHFSLERT